MLRASKRAGSARVPQSSFSQPRARWRHVAASVGRKVYLRGGYTRDYDVDDLRSTVHTFGSIEEAWASARATGQPHPGLYLGACAAAGEELFYYGGWDGTARSSALSRFSPATLNWACLSSGSPDGPMAKFGCRMVSCGEGLLCVFAGFGIPTGPTQPGSQFIKHTGSTDGSGWTNELHLFNINGGVWSSPALTGTRPCPRAAFTLTAINGHQAIGFGGYNQEHGYLNDTVLIDFSKMEWSQLDIKGELPVPRRAHAACCLNFGDDHPQLLVTSGKDRHSKVLDDAWILDILQVARTWRKVDLPSGSLPRASHSLTAIALGEGVTEVVSFGGYCKWPENYKNDDDVDPIDETTVMRFVSCPSPPSADSPSQWALTNVANSRHLGSKKRVAAKKLVAELSMKHHHTMATLRPQATSSSDESHSLREIQQALQDSREREQVFKQQAQEAERRLQEAEELTHQFQQLADAFERRVQNAKRRAEEVTTRAEEETARAQRFEARVQVAERNLEEATARATQLQQQTEQRVQTVEARLQEVTEQLRNVRADADRRVREASRQLAQSQASSSSWVVQHAEVEYTSDPELGRGGWAAVKVAKFRGLRVAAKCPYDEIISDYNRQMFVREMNMAARLRHPNLLQFIGATIKGRMVILTELLPTSLRALFRQGPLSTRHITSISLDVAQALNYLHLMRPDPIVHRDISSANVLLEPGPNNSWKAKVSDYGSVNLQQHLRTTGAGSPVYAAPEANSPDQQSPKMDVFSFGVLLVEMCTAQFPEVSEREAHILSIPHAHFVALIRHCLQINKDNRPTASDLITELTR